MNNHEIQELLIGYAEGTLSVDRIAEMESLLASSPELRQDLEILRSAFEELQGEEDGTVPEFYFTNFLPKLRERLDQGAGYSPWSIPRLWQMLFRPAMVLMIVASLYGLYRTFDPEFSPSPIYTLVNEFEQNEIAALIEESSPFPVSTTESLYQTKLPGEVLGIDPSNYQTENEVFAFLEDQEAEQVVDRIQRTAAR